MEKCLRCGMISPEELSETNLQILENQFICGCSEEEYIIFKEQESKCYDTEVRANMVRMYRGEQVLEYSVMPNHTLNVQTSLPDSNSIMDTQLLKVLEGCIHKPKEINNLFREYVDKIIEFHYVNKSNYRHLNMDEFLIKEILSPLLKDLNQSSYGHSEGLLFLEMAKLIIINCDLTFNEETSKYVIDLEGIYHSLNIFKEEEKLLVKALVKSVPEFEELEKISEEVSYNETFNTGLDKSIFESKIESVKTELQNRILQNSFEFEDIAKVLGYKLDLNKLYSDYQNSNVYLPYFLIETK